MGYNSKSYRKFLASSVAAAAVVSAVAPIAPITAEAATNKFSDVKADAWYKNNVEYLVGNGVLDGFTDGTFRPIENVTRAQAAKMLAVSLGLEVIKTPTLDFKDTKNDAWYAGYVAALVDAGIVEGYENGTFKPNASITRAAFAKMVVEAYNLEKDATAKVELNDLVPGAWYEEYVTTLFSLGVVGGKGAGKFEPNSNVTRAESAAFLHRTEVEEQRLAVEKEVAEDTELVVNSVSASTTAIKQAADQQLQIKVNGNKTVTIEELKEAGYEVEFLFNRTASNTQKTTGLLNGATGVFSADFKYAVKLTKDTETITSDWTDVKVVNALEAVSVKKVGLKANGEDFGLDYITLSDENVTIAATEVANFFGETEDVSLPEVEKITSSDVTVAYFSAENGVIVPVSEGTVTFTIKFVGIEEPINLTVNVKAAQKAATISAENVKVKAQENADIEFFVLDQYSKALRVGSKIVDVKIVDKEGAEVYSANGVTVPVGGKVTLQNFNQAEGVYTVVASVTGEAIGSFTVETVTIDPTKVDSYTLTVADKAKVDLNGADTLAVNVNAFVKGVKLTGADLTAALEGLQIRSSDTSILTVGDLGTTFTVTGKKEGTAKVELRKVEGDLITTFATLDVEVVNTTPQVSSLSFKQGVTKVKGVANTPISESISKANVLAAVTAGHDRDDNEILTAEMINNVTFVDSDKKVIVKLHDLYGGKSFTFDAELVPAATLSSAEFTVAPLAGDTPSNGTLVLTFSEAINIVENFDLTIANASDETATVAVSNAQVSQDGKTVTISVDPASELANATTISAINLLDYKGDAVELAEPVTITRP
ncbi:S-layer homology domain-containing protein [Halalkalibacter nanhaiisediminis]|uniref:S-layer family protein n=1 Tax=Halalkalibacter nanhaiisediminis TaxID=688079 RepID=A0A562QT61_9BACI|nr:S-layer homology domain-containing protein [Halalkalibacter nanhaiisediminis]TWI59833.1 S-layer family protein [Halalkalibacter nanhaiisediminis]